MRGIGTETILGHNHLEIGVILTELGEKPFGRIAFTVILGGLFLAGQAFAQTDPGPRGGTAGAGNPVAGLTTNQLRISSQNPDLGEAKDAGRFAAAVEEFVVPPGDIFPSRVGRGSARRGGFLLGRTCRAGFSDGLVEGTRCGSSRGG